MPELGWRLGNPLAVAAMAAIGACAGLATASDGRARACEGHEASLAKLRPRLRPDRRLPQQRCPGSDGTNPNSRKMEGRTAMSRPSDMTRQAIELYAQGWSTRQIGAELGRDHSRVARWLQVARLSTETTARNHPASRWLRCGVLPTDLLTPRCYGRGGRVPTARREPFTLNDDETGSPSRRAQLRRR